MTALLDLLGRNIRLLGILAILVCGVTGWIDPFRTCP
jgi:hypothetical protein